MEVTIQGAGHETVNSNNRLRGKKSGGPKHHKANLITKENYEKRMTSSQQ